jgi:hypothetical protein
MSFSWVDENTLVEYLNLWTFSVTSNSVKFKLILVAFCNSRIGSLPCACKITGKINVTSNRLVYTTSSGRVPGPPGEPTPCNCVKLWADYF